MAFDGRLEKRIPIAVSVYLASAREPRSGEKTLTENVSLHGARVVTKGPWQPGEQSLITSLTGEFAGRPATVVYSQPLADGRFCVGLEFPGCAVNWGELQLRSTA
jgi:hypothetical protein